MNESLDEQIANMEEGIALPRKNGELVFEAPWEKSLAYSLAFGFNPLLP